MFLPAFPKWPASVSGSSRRNADRLIHSSTVCGPESADRLDGSAPRKVYQTEKGGYDTSPVRRLALYTTTRQSDVFTLADF